MKSRTDPLNWYESDQGAVAAPPTPDLPPPPLRRRAWWTTPLMLVASIVALYLVFVALRVSGAIAY